MITFIILAITLLALLIGILVFGLTAGSVFLVVFADFIVFGLIVWVIYKAALKFKRGSH